MSVSWEVQKDGNLEFDTVNKKRDGTTNGYQLELIYGSGQIISAYEL